MCKRVMLYGANKHKYKYMQLGGANDFAEIWRAQKRSHKAFLNLFVMAQNCYENLGKLQKAV